MYCDLLTNGVLITNARSKSLYRSPTMGDFYGTGIEIWAGFGSVGITEKIKRLQSPH